MFVDVPLSLYIHIPWCESKCPYCDFNSHTLTQLIPHQVYTDRLIDDLAYQYTAYGRSRPIKSIFFGGGTPSLFNGEYILKLLNRIRAYCPLETNVEITIECNPNSVCEKQLGFWEQAGINRISLGVQSFNNSLLRALGRVHDAQCAKHAMRLIRASGIQYLNVDIMYGLPGQNDKAHVVHDIKTAHQQGATHLSVYQLTIEPNTAFAQHPPVLPNDSMLDKMLEAATLLLERYDFKQYEVSAYGTQPCRHNINYWEFGDYIGIGAGAHAKLSNPVGDCVMRLCNQRVPEKYMQKHVLDAVQSKRVNCKQRIAEFALNAFRMKRGFSLDLFERHTFLDRREILPMIEQGVNRGWLSKVDNQIQTTAIGWRFLNDVQLLFLSD